MIFSRALVCGDKAAWKGKMASIDISVIIPTYNREKYIKKAIESVLDQEGQGIGYKLGEIIVVDDGSTDDTETLVSRIADGRIRFHKMETNSGAGAARNKGVSIANGDWVAFQDSDDVWDCRKLAKQVDYLNENPDVSMVSHPIKAVFDDGREITTSVKNAENMVSILAERNLFDTPTMLLKRECFIALGGFNTELKALEDWEFALRFADKYKIGMVPEVLIESEMISDGVSSGAANYYESRCKMIALDRDILMSYGCFDDAVRSLLMHANNNGVFEMVGKMLELYLKSK